MKDTPIRILDANFNRSREALRVMEEFARFALDDASLSAAIKKTRHDLANANRSLRGQIAPGGKAEPLVMARDSVGDVGTVISTPSEAKRTDAAEVVIAACKRLTESLRCLEEYGKIIDATFAATIEQLRYRAYDLERRLVTTVSGRQKFANVHLYVLITEAFCNGDWFAVAQNVIEGGADCVQLREKSLPDRELLERAKRLAQLCRDSGRICIINDRPDIALAAGAHGVHLGQDDLPVAAARRLLPGQMIVGLSTHTLEQIEAAIAVTPDYIAVGPMYDSPTKPQPLVAGPGLLAEARKRTAIPLVAIGGITIANVQSVLEAAAGCICVCRSVLAAPDPTAATRQLRRQIDSAVRVQNF